MVILASEALLRENKKNPATKCYPSEHWTRDLIHLDLMLSSPSSEVMCYLGDLRSFMHALLVLTKWSKSKIEVVPDQRQFKDVPSSTFIDSSDRRSLDLSSWGPRFNSHFGNILLTDFCFHVVMPILPLLPILCDCEVA